MPIIVQKYGGSSVATPEKIRKVADRIIRTRDAGYEVAVVVSAMGDTTDDLLARAHALAESPDRRELDMLVSSGERISMALLAIALRERGCGAVSFTGSQAGIVTNDRHYDARIIEVRPIRVADELARGNVVVVGGYQGVSYRRDVTTLGRGGSDTTAVALAAALGAEWCEICSDVDGVCTADPRVVPDARHIDALTFQETQEMAEAGAKVLNATAVEFAKEKNIAIYARATDAEPPRAGAPAGGTVVRKDAPRPPGTVTGIAHEKEVIVIRSPDALRADALLGTLDELGVCGKQLEIQNFGGASGSVVLLVSRDRIPSSGSLRSKLPEGCDAVAGLGAVSAIGAGINQSYHNVLAGNAALHGAGIAPAGLSTSSFRITWLVPSERVEDAARTLHTHFIASHAPTQSY